MSQSYPPLSPASAGAGNDAKEPLRSADPAVPVAAASTSAAAASTGPEAVQDLLSQLETIARQLEGQPDVLLSLLRSIEQLHRTIQDGPFRASLPADRNALFRLLSEMERSGGWPYIPRLQLRTFLDLLNHGASEESLSVASQSPGLSAPDSDLSGSSSLAA